MFRFQPKTRTPLSERQALLSSHLTVNTYFFVSTIPKILTEFSFGIGMVNTEKYRPIPTEKYRLGKQLYYIAKVRGWVAYQV